MEEKEKRVRLVTGIYYSRKEIQEAIAEFSKNREVVPRYFEGFGKRPDVIQYVSDVLNLAKKGATSFHCSEELWSDALQINSDMHPKELNELRIGWDLLIDVDSPFLDCSKIATQLILGALEHNGVKNYGIKFSGSKGFHIIVSGKAFPEEFDGKLTREMFPEWPRAICGYLMDYIKEDYNKKASEILTDFDAIEKRTKISKEQLQEMKCTQCGSVAQKGEIMVMRCDTCGMVVERKNAARQKNRLKCLRNDCAGVLREESSKEFYYCLNCKDPDNKNIELNNVRNPDFFEKPEGVSAEKIASLDLVLVAPRHLFRAPYSLHEKTALSSVVIGKEEIEKFSPKEANPMNVKVKNFLPENPEGEAKRLLSAALDWRRGREIKEKQFEEKKYSGKQFEETNFENVTEDMFPPAIKKLLEGLEDGKKRGLFVLITFLRSLNFSADYVNKKVREWNEKNEPPLKEGYIKSQVDWHFKQKKKILPPNYSNQAFYQDLGLIKEMPKTKNPLVDVARNIRRRD